MLLDLQKTQRILLKEALACDALPADSFFRIRCFDDTRSSIYKMTGDR